MGQRTCHFLIRISQWLTVLRSLQALTSRGPPGLISRIKPRAHQGGQDWSMGDTQKRCWFNTHSCYHLYHTCCPTRRPTARTRPESYSIFRKHSHARPTKRHEKILIQSSSITSWRSQRLSTYRAAPLQLAHPSDPR